MLTQKQSEIEEICEQINTMALLMTMEAARSEMPMAREYAIIAEETRKLAYEISAALRKNIYGNVRDDDFDKFMLDIFKMSTFVVLNGGLVCCKSGNRKVFSVLVEEFRALSVMLGRTCGQTGEYFDIPHVSPKSAVVSDWITLFTISSGKYRWTENAKFVQEVFLYVPDFIQGNRLIIKEGYREMDMPFIKLGEVTENSGIVIISDAFDPKKHYAVLADFYTHMIISTNIGVNKPCNADIPIRECWSASDDSDVIFPDWERMAEEA